MEPKIKNRNISLVAATSFCYAPYAFASGDITVLFAFFIQLVLVVVFLATLASWRTGRERMIVSAWFFGSLIGIEMLTANVPYSRNAVLLTAASVLTPLLGWFAGWYFAQASRPS